MHSDMAGLPAADLDRAQLSPESGRAQSVAIFAVLVVQIALLFVGILLCLVKFGSGSESDQGGGSPTNPQSTAATGAEADDGKKPEATRKADGEKGPSSDPSKAGPDRIRATVQRELSETARGLENQFGVVQKAVTDLGSPTGTLARMGETLTRVNANVEDTRKKLITLASDDGKLARVMKSLDHLERLVTEVNSRSQTAKSDVIVIVCESPTQRFKPFLKAYKAAIDDNPSRFGFKRHRVGLWIAQGIDLNPVLPHNEPPAKASDIWDRFQKSQQTISNQSLVDPTGLGDKVLKDFANRLDVTRFILVVPADADAPPEGSWPGARVDVVLVAARYDTPAKDVANWVRFCSGRGLLSLLRPDEPPALPAAAPGPEAAVKKASDATPTPGGPRAKAENNDKAPDANAAPVDATKSPSPAAMPEADPGLLKRLATELIRLTQPSPPTALDSGN